MLARRVITRVQKVQSAFRRNADYVARATLHFPKDARDTRFDSIRSRGAIIARCVTAIPARLDSIFKTAAISRISELLFSPENERSNSRPIPAITRINVKRSISSDRPIAEKNVTFPRETSNISQSRNLVTALHRSHAA